MSSEANQNVAAAIRAEMARQRVTTRQLASKLGVSAMWVSRRFSGEVAATVGDVHDIATALGIDPDVLLAPRHSAAS
ncbi:MAG TPA: helix-turn-helix transcriptional regulator [Kribbella sp.]|uniref:helix-turn-helix domain-containing protein n=1 Tax=Kribbella sp. TaxID=1871183 RepID=UPI002D79DE51|nr:helix-turn-helix transcriptional regulator [Kribbella sp.]HET6298612.1 helix-turn-helix transcriptional regulator [Kribbella sp.]